MKFKDILIVMVILLACAACSNNQKDSKLAVSNVYPYTDTITLGLKSESGSYATIQYSIKYLG